MLTFKCCSKKTAGVTVLGGIQKFLKINPFGMKKLIKVPGKQIVFT